MDRTTAQRSLRNKSQFISHHTKINSSNFQKSSQEPAQMIKKLKQLAQEGKGAPTETTSPAPVLRKSILQSAIAPQKCAKVTPQMPVSDEFRGPFTSQA